MKKVFGYLLLTIVIFLVYDSFITLNNVALDMGGVYGAIYNFTIFPLSFLIFPFVRFFVANNPDEVVLLVIMLALSYAAIKLLSKNENFITKPNRLSVNEKDLPHQDFFDTVKSLLGVPFAYYLIIFNAGLTATIGILLIGGIYYFEASATGRVHSGVLFLLGVGTFIGVVASLRALLAGLKRPKQFEVAIELKDVRSPIYTMVREVSSMLNVKIPDHILISFQPDFHVHQTKSILLEGTTINGRTLTIGLPFVKYLYEQEIKAVLAHELSHFSGGDTIFSLYVVPMYKSFQTILNDLASLMSRDDTTNNENQGLLILPNLLSYFLLTQFYLRYQKLISKIDRIREARADIISVNYFGNEALSNALTYVSKIGMLFNSTVQDDYWNMITKYDKKFINYYDHFDKTYMMDSKIKKLLKTLTPEDSVTSVFDSHFSIKERIDYFPDNNISYKRTRVLNNLELNELEEKLSDLYGEFMGLVYSNYRPQKTVEEVNSPEQIKTI